MRLCECHGEPMYGPYGPYPNHTATTPFYLCRVKNGDYFAKRRRALLAQRKRIANQLEEMRNGTE